MVSERYVTIYTQNEDDFYNLACESSPINRGVNQKNQ